MFSWWSGLTALGKGITSVSAALVILGAGAGVVTGHFSLPSENAATIVVIEADVDSMGHGIREIQTMQRQSDEKMDRVLCILEGTDPLTCERETG